MIRKVNVILFAVLFWLPLESDGHSLAAPNAIGIAAVDLETGSLIWEAWTPRQVPEDHRKALAHWIQNWQYPLTKDHDPIPDIKNGGSYQSKNFLHLPTTRWNEVYVVENDVLKGIPQDSPLDKPRWNLPLPAEQGRIVRGGFDRVWVVTTSLYLCIDPDGTVIHRHQFDHNWNETPRFSLFGDYALFSDAERRILANATTGQVIEATLTHNKLTKLPSLQLEGLHFYKLPGDFFPSKPDQRAIVCCMEDEILWIARDSREAPVIFQNEVGHELRSASPNFEVSQWVGNTWDRGLMSDHFIYIGKDWKEAEFAYSRWKDPILKSRFNASPIIDRSRSVIYLRVSPEHCLPRTFHRFLGFTSGETQTLKIDAVNHDQWAIGMVELMKSFGGGLILAKLQSGEFGSEPGEEAKRKIQSMLKKGWPLAPSPDRLLQAVKTQLTSTDSMPSLRQASWDLLLVDDVFTFDTGDLNQLEAAAVAAIEEKGFVERQQAARFLFRHGETPLDSTWIIEHLFKVSTGGEAVFLLAKHGDRETAAKLALQENLFDFSIPYGFSSESFSSFLLTSSNTAPGAAETEFYLHILTWFPDRVDNLWLDRFSSELPTKFEEVIRRILPRFASKQFPPRFYNRPGPLPVLLRLLANGENQADNELFLKFIRHPQKTFVYSAKNTKKFTFDTRQTVYKILESRSVEGFKRLPVTYIEKENTDADPFGK